MLQRVQDRSLLHVFGDTFRIRLNAAQKAIAQWAVLDDYNTILDLRCRDTRLLDYLSQRYSLRACGITEEASAVHALRDSMPDAEIICARKEDIPWRDQSFDSIFFQIDKSEPYCGDAFLAEALRVLKPCGQLLVTVTGMPELLCRAANCIGVADLQDRVRPRALLNSMEEAGYDDVSYRLVSPFVGLAIGWKWK